MAYTITFKLNAGWDTMIRLTDPERTVELRKALNSILLEQMQMAIVMARTRCPVRTGALRDSIGILDIDEENMMITGGTELYYGRFVECGTYLMHARPFWRPAIWEAFFRARREMIEAHERWLHG